MEISVILLAFKDRGFLKQAEKSIKQQTFKDYEVIVADQPISVGANLNRAIEQAKGRYICYLCDDDMFPPRSLEQRHRIMTLTDAHFCHGCAEIIKPDKSVVPFMPRLQYPYLEDMIINNVINGGTVMYRRDCFDLFGWFDERLKTAEEYDYNMKLLSKGARIEYVDEITYIYRKHNQQKSFIHNQKEMIKWRTKQRELIRARYRG